MAKTVYNKKVKNGKEYYFYRLRHENLKNPKDIYAKTVHELLGHSTVSITLNTYTHVLESVKQNTISKLDKLQTMLK